MLYFYKPDIQLITSFLLFTDALCMFHEWLPIIWTVRGDRRGGCPCGHQEHPDCPGHWCKNRKWKVSIL